MITQSTKSALDEGFRSRAAHVCGEDDDGDHRPGDAQECHRVSRDLLDPIHEIVATADRLGAGDHPAPLFLLAGLVLEAFVLEAFQPLDALYGRRLLLRCCTARSSFRLGGVRHSETKIAGGELATRFLVWPLSARLWPYLFWAWARTASMVSMISMVSSSGISGLSASPALRQRATSSAS